MGDTAAAYGSQREGSMMRHESVQRWWLVVQVAVVNFAGQSGSTRAGAVCVRTQCPDTFAPQRRRASSLGFRPGDVCS